MVIVVSDTSPIISLAAIGRLDLLAALYPSVIIPIGVLRELEANPPKWSPTSATFTWLKPTPLAQREVFDQLSSHLGLGEAEAIALALELGAEVLLIDEARGRRAAKAHGIQVMGVLGILLGAKSLGLLDAVGPVVEELQTYSGYRVSDELIYRVLALAGELGS